MITLTTSSEVIYTLTLTFCPVSDTSNSRFVDRFENKMTPATVQSESDSKSES